MSNPARANPGHASGGLNATAPAATVMETSRRDGRRDVLNGSDGAPEVQPFAQPGRQQRPARDVGRPHPYTAVRKLRKLGCEVVHDEEAMQIRRRPHNSSQKRDRFPDDVWKNETG